MKRRRIREQHIAVFGGSGSGKTVLVSSFYGSAQEDTFREHSPFDVIADDVGQGNWLHQNYLGMREESRLPQATRFGATSYAFSVQLKEEAGSKATKRRPFDALRLVWHDYPGEWFEQDTQGEAETQRRVDTFKNLLSSDVAFLLVDGQRLLDYAGEEERYLKSLFTNYRNGLLALKDELLAHGKPLVRFPRIWIVTLSKADLLPDMDARKFRELIILKAAGDLDELRYALSRFVAGNEALAVGEDFMLLSSAKFEVDRIEVHKSVGLNLILPLAAMLPFERHVRWAQTKALPGKVAEALLGAGEKSAGALGAAMLGLRVLPGPLGVFRNVVGAFLSDAALREAAKLAGSKLQEANFEARLTHDRLAATLTGFKLELDEAERDRVLLRSPR